MTSNTQNQTENESDIKE